MPLSISPEIGATYEISYSCPNRFPRSETCTLVEIFKANSYPGIDAINKYYHLPSGCREHQKANRPMKVDRFIFEYTKNGNVCHWIILASVNEDEYSITRIDIARV